MKAVRYVGSDSNCKEYMNSLVDGSDYVVVDTMAEGGNVTLRAHLDDSPVEFRLDSITRDFLDLATLVYVVDEMEKRKNASDRWTRDFDILAPVDAPSVWTKHQVLFTQMLQTLSGDRYSFTWCPRPTVGGYGSHRLLVPWNYDVVCLFSGGIDSFLGAYRLLETGKKVLLVGHQADGTAASAQSDLVKFLKQKFPEKVKLVQFRVARSMAGWVRYVLPDKCEESHRPRSLLFLALAVGIAKSVRISTVYIPENGLIALNPPLGKSRLGSLSTRTAHPKYLTELADFLSRAGVFDGTIKNPFLFESKTDMLLNLSATLHAPMRRTVSCARPSRYKDLGVNHCGYCMPCIYRRIAMLGPNLDVPKDYAFDLFGNLSAVETSKQIDLRSLVAFAKRFLSSSGVERELVVLAHGAFSAATGERFGGVKTNSYGPWVDMIERWSIDFLEKLRRITSKATRRIIAL